MWRGVCIILFTAVAPSLQVPCTDHRPQDGPRGWGEREGEWEGGVSGAVRRTTGMFFVGATASSILHTDWRHQVLPRKTQWASALCEWFPGWESSNSSFTKKSCTCASIALPAGFTCWPVNSSNCGKVQVVSSACICLLVHCQDAVSNAKHAASNDELERVWKEMVVAWSEVYSNIFLHGLRRTTNNLSVRIVGIASKIRKRHLINYHMRQLASK
jgi:hypothetical protein